MNGKRIVWLAALPVAAFLAYGLVQRSRDGGSRELPPSSYQYQPSGATDLIVFVHGIWGGRDSTWIANGTDFRVLLATDTAPYKVGDSSVTFSRFAIFSASYYSPKSGTALTIPDLASRLETQLASKGVFDYSRIHFIAHSMGGVVVKEMLMNMKAGNNAGLTHVRSVLLIATPAGGSQLAEYASRLRVFSTDQLNALRPLLQNTFLQAEDIEWTKFVRSGRDAGLPRVYCAFEGRPVAFGFFVVDKEQARTACDDEPYALETKDHFGTVKPTARDDDPYDWVTHRVLAALGAGPVGLSLALAAGQSLESAIRFIAQQDQAVARFDATCSAGLLSRPISAGQLKGTVPEIIQAVGSLQSRKVHLSTKHEGATYVITCGA